MNNQKIEQLIQKIDGFAETLDADEQRMLANLLAGADDVSGFSDKAGWQGASIYISIVWGHAEAPIPGQPSAEPMTRNL